MARIQIRPLTCVFAVWLWSGFTAVPQTSKPAVVSQQLPVYIVDFRQELRPELIPEFGHLSTFTSGLIQLRLLEIPSVTVHRVQTAPTCESAPPPVNQAVQALRAPVTPPGDFYTVQGLIETQLPNVILSYSVEKCEGQKLKKVFEDTQPFTLDHALDEITIAAHAIAFKIERVIPPTQVDVTVFETDGDLPEQKDVATDVHKAVIREIAKSPDYEVTNSSDYKIAGHITFQKARLSGVFSSGAVFTAEMHVQAHGKSYPLKSITGSRDQLPKFNEAVSGEVMRGLPEVLLAEHLQLPGFVENMKADKLFDQGNQLLDECPAKGECTSAQDAVTLLSAAAQQESKSWKISFLLGKAQMRAGKPGDAVVSLQKAQGLIKQDLNSGQYVSLADQVQVLNQLGNAYRNANRYELAETAYDQSLRLDPSQAAIYRSKAQVFQYENSRLEALQSLIEGLKISGQDSESQSLHDSAKNVVFSLQDSDEINAAEKTLYDALLAGLPISNEYALLVTRKWSQILDTDWTAKNRANARKELKNILDRRPSDPEVLAYLYGTCARAELVDGNRQRLQELVAKAEQLPANQVPASWREWIERILAEDYVNNAEYEKAIEAADNAYHILPTNDASYTIADSTLLLARCKEEVWKLGKVQGDKELCKPGVLFREDDTRGDVKLTPAQDAELRKYYQEAADHATPLVTARYPGGDFVLMRANHYLGQDHQTEDQFLHLVQQDPNDASALNTVMYVCSQYLFDFNCAFTAAQKAADSLPKTGPTAASDYLNIAEAAVLKGDDKTALDWLDIVSHQPNSDPRDTSLVHLYRLWVDMRQGQTGKFKSDFDSWQEAAGRFRASKEELNWIFLGARKALQNSKSGIGKNRASLLVSMMDALDNRGLALPTWPESGLL